MSEDRELYSLEAEQGVLGALMLDQSLADRVFGLVDTADFYFDDNAALFEEEIGRASCRERVYAPV